MDACGTILVTRDVLLSPGLLPELIRQTQGAGVLRFGGRSPFARSAGLSKLWSHTFEIQEDLQAVAWRS
jgi:hypothetical protein